MPDTIETEALLALTALSAPECEKCHKPLKPGQMECCNRLYCPFCRKPVIDETCEHVVAWRMHGRWTIPGVIPIVAPVETIPVEPDHEIEWSPAQKRSAFGKANDVVHRIWGEGLAIPPTRGQVRQRLLEAVPCTRIASFNADSRNVHCAFHPDPADFVRQARALIDAWEKGFATLRNTIPTAAGRLLGRHALAPFGGDRWAVSGLYSYRTNALFLTFSPDGSRLAVGLNGRVELRAVPTGEVLWSIPLETAAPRSAVWTDDGSTLAVMTSTSAYLWQTLLLDPATGAVRATLPASGTTGHQIVGSGTLASLHGGRLLVDVEGRNVRLTTLGSDGGVASTELLVHRAPIKCFGASPDGETFATVAQNTLLLWRVP